MAICVFTLAIIAGRSIIGPSDASIRDRVVKLSSRAGSCTGEQVRAPSGKDYILTAAHCLPIAVNGMMQATDSMGDIHYVRVIAEDAEADLLILEGLEDVRGLNIAETVHIRDGVRTFTHGAGFPTYRTEGTIIGEQYIQVPLSEVESLEDYAKCTSQAKTYVEDMFGLKICILVEATYVTDAMIVPGSSGGPVVDSNGDLIGVVSAGGGGFGYLVPLRPIHKFLANY